MINSKCKHCESCFHLNHMSNTARITKAAAEHILDFADLKADVAEGIIETYELALAMHQDGSLRIPREIAEKCREIAKIRLKSTGTVGASLVLDYFQ